MQIEIEEDIKRKLQEGITTDQISQKEYVDPFTGEPVNKGKKKIALKNLPVNTMWLADHSMHLQARLVFLPYRQRADHPLSEWF